MNEFIHFQCLPTQNNTIACVFLCRMLCFHFGWQKLSGVFTQWFRCKIAVNCISKWWKINTRFYLFVQYFQSSNGVIQWRMEIPRSIHVKVNETLMTNGSNNQSSLVPIGNFSHSDSIFSPRPSYKGKTKRIQSILCFKTIKSWIQKWSSWFRKWTWNWFWRTKTIRWLHNACAVFVFFSFLFFSFQCSITFIHFKFHLITGWREQLDVFHIDRLIDLLGSNQIACDLCKFKHVF